MQIINSLIAMLNEMSPYILLGFLIAGIMHAFISQQTFARHLSGRGWRSVVKAAAIGVPLPLCSCGVLPTAIGMRRNGASRAATTSFLVATPQTGVDSIAATWSLLGPAFAVVRPVAALVTAIFGGVAVGKSEQANNQQPTTNNPSHHDDCGCTDGCCSSSSFKDERPEGFVARIIEAVRYGFVDLVGSIGGWLMAGLLIAALITVYVPADFFAVLGSNPVLSMLAVLVIAIPMYVCATGSIPIAMSLVMKGLSPGTALVLLMAGPAANFASFTLISREMGRKAASIYLAAIIIGAMGFGLLIDYVLPTHWFAIAADHCTSCNHHDVSWLSWMSSGILVALLIYTYLKRYIKPKNQISSDMATQYTIKGMNCPHCQAAVTKAIAGVEGVENVEVNLSTGIASVEGTHNADAIRQAVEAAGFNLA